MAAAGWLNPAVAAGLLIVSSLLVISNSLRLMSSVLEDQETATPAVVPDRITGPQVSEAAVG